MFTCITAVKSVIRNNPLKVKIIDQDNYVATELYKTGLSANTLYKETAL